MQVCSIVSTSGFHMQHCGALQGTIGEKSTCKRPSTYASHTSQCMQDLFTDRLSPYMLRRETSTCHLWATLAGNLCDGVAGGHHKCFGEKFGKGGEGKTCKIDVQNSVSWVASLHRVQCGWPALVGWRFLCVCAFDGFLLWFRIACACPTTASLCNNKPPQPGCDTCI